MSKPLDKQSTATKYQIDLGQDHGMPQGLVKVIDLLHDAATTGAQHAAVRPAAQQGNIFDQSAPPTEGERFEALHQQTGVLIERIVSSPRIAHEQYIQQQDEWVLLLQGEATLDVAGESIALHSGDYLLIPAQTPHTVTRVSDGAIWLAIHMGISTKAI